MVKSKSNKSRLLREFQELIVSEVVSQELRVFLVESLNHNHNLRKGFGLKPVNTSKTPSATIDNPIYSEILKQRLQGKAIGQAITDAGTALSETDSVEDIEKSIMQVHCFYYKTAGGQNEKNIKKTFKCKQKLIDRRIDTKIYAEVVVQLLKDKSIDSALTDAGEALGKTESQMSAFYKRGDYKKYIQNNYKQAQNLIEINKK